MDTTAALNMAVPGEDEARTRAGVNNNDDLKPKPKRHTPPLAVVAMVSVVIATVISVVVYLFVKNRRQIADQVATRSTLQTTAEMFAVKLGRELTLSPIGNDKTVTSSSNAALFAALQSYDATRVVDAGRVVTVEIIDVESGSLYASSLRPTWTESSGSRPGRSIYGGVDDGAGGGLQSRVNQAVAKGGGFISFQFINPVTSDMRLRDTFVVPVPGSSLCVMVGVDV